MHNLTRRSILLGGLATLAPVSAAGTEVQIENWLDLPKGQHVSYMFRQQPWTLWHRTDAQTQAEQDVNVAELADPTVRHANLGDAQNGSDTGLPATNQNIGFGPGHRFILMSLVCPRRGCVVMQGARGFGGFFCPCGSAHYDTAGRVRRGPYARNLSTLSVSLDGSTLIAKEGITILHDKAIKRSLGWD